MQQKGAQARKEEANWVNPDAVAVHAVVEGFIGGKGKLFATKELAAATGALRPKLRLTILDLSGVKLRENKVRRMKDNPLGIELCAQVSVSAVAAAYARDGEGAVEAAKKKKAEEDAKIKGMSEDEKKKYRTEQKELREKCKGEVTMYWHSVVPGMSIDVNVFDAKKILGLERNAEVSIEGFTIKPTVWLKEPKKGGFGGDPALAFSVFYNVSGFSMIRMHRNPQSLYEKIPAFSCIDPSPTYTDLTLDLTEPGDKDPFIFKLQMQEVTRFIRIPVRLEYNKPPVPASKQLGITASLLPNDGIDDFRNEKKEFKEQNDAEGTLDVEKEEAYYTHFKTRLAVVPYKNDPMKEIEDGTALVHNVVVNVGNYMTMQALGITRERYHSRIMEANGQSMEWEIIATLDARGTRGNKLNLTNHPAETGMAGNIIHRAKSARCNLADFLLRKAFHPSNEFVFEHFKDHVQQLTADVGYLDLKTANPYADPNPLLQLYKGKQPLNRGIVPLFCIQETAAHYLKPEDFTVCAITSTWFAQQTKRSDDGIIEQDQILQKIGKLSQEEADKCLRNEADAQYPVGEDPVILIYAVRNLGGKPRVFGGPTTQDDSSEDSESAELLPPPPTQRITKKPEKEVPRTQRDTGAMDIDDSDDD